MDMSLWGIAPLSTWEVSVLIGLGHILFTIFLLAWILSLKKDSMSALAWCLTVFLLPALGPILFWFFGYQNVHRPIKRKQRHTRAYRREEPRADLVPPELAPRPSEDDWQNLARYALQFDTFPLREGNKVTFFDDGPPLFEAILAVIEQAQHHIHIETFILRSDDTGERLMDALCAKAKSGVEVRLLYDAIGAYDLSWGLLRRLRRAGGEAAAFLSPWNPLRRVQINLRNHRKLVVIDGRVGFVGGQNFGDEYLGKSKQFGYWRDSHLQIEGPAVTDLQRIFVEDWDFGKGQHLKGKDYFPKVNSPGNTAVQVIESGPDQDIKAIREVLFAAIQRASRRIWIASPYFVPDAGLRDSLLTAGRYGLDVRLLVPFRPDKWIPFLAARYYFREMLTAGVKIYQYTHGFLHSKVVLIDNAWGSVGSANLDNRSLHLNFELNCLLYTPSAVKKLEDSFLADFGRSIRLSPEVFATRPLMSKIAENACRLLSPVL